MGNITERAEQSALNIARELLSQQDPLAVRKLAVDSGREAVDQLVAHSTGVAELPIERVLALTAFVIGSGKIIELLNQRECDHGIKLKECGICTPNARSDL